jgi:cysteinyl-tRNA synthetase
VLNLYNTLTRRQEPFEPADGQTVTMYTCGPTVYDFAHIGNMRSFVLYDLVHRVFRHRGWGVRHVMNITDVDDKIIAAAEKHGISIQEHARPFEEAFREDLATLNIETSDVIMPRATEWIPQMVELIERLVEKKHAYVSEGSVYFDIDSFAGYGRLSGVDPRSQARRREFGRLEADAYDRDDVQDFALWKHAKEGEPAWASPWGPGRPGWHIECSAMAGRLLGETIDVHMGGVDLQFPHHENEIAQTEAATGKPLARFWIHGEHLLIDGAKMAKSAGNYRTLRDLLAEGHDPMAIRLALMSAHYRRQLSFSLDGLAQATRALQGVRDFVQRARQAPATAATGELQGAGATARERFEAALEDDLNWPAATAQVFELIKAADVAADRGGAGAEDLAEVLACLQAFDEVLGLRLVSAAEVLDEEIERLIEQRRQARAARDFARSDAIRQELETQGILLEDTPGGTRWRRAGG